MTENPALCSFTKVVKLKSVYYSMYVPAVVRQNVLVPGFLTCYATLFECLQHVQLELRQITTYLNTTSHSCSLYWFEHG